MLDEQRAKERLFRVRERIERACRGSGRDPSGVTLVAVSKFQPAQAVSAMYACGQRLFGENYVQEALAKMEVLKSPDIRWHFIGRLQKNKAKFVVGRFALVHTVDSLDLAQTLQKRALAAGVVQPVLIQVNLDDEPQMAGVASADAPALAEAVAGMDHLALEGLMVLPRALDDPRLPAAFAGWHPRDTLRTAWRPLRLSMGMSGDLEAAVRKGPPCPGGDRSFRTARVTRQGRRRDEDQGARQMADDSEGGKKKSGFLKWIIPGDSAARFAGGGYFAYLKFLPRSLRPRRPKARPRRGAWRPRPRPSPSRPRPRPTARPRAAMAGQGRARESLVTFPPSWSFWPIPRAGGSQARHGP
jgi:pyridoxal phosphate enzyme (YggS family)